MTTGGEQIQREAPCESPAGGAQRSAGGEQVVMTKNDDNNGWLSSLPT